MIFERTEQLLGARAFAAVRNAKVAVFGLGGVGSWCLEALVRSGIGEFLMVDFDTIAESNVNRQLPATSKTIGEVKARVLAARMREINPDVKLSVREEKYTAETANSFALENYDYVIDAIDSVPHKAALIRHALSIPTVTLFSSMGAGKRVDPLKVTTSEFRKIEGDGLARALRQNFKKTALYPSRPFTCVWSREMPRENGTLAPVTGVFGLTLASLVLADLERKAL